MTDIIQTPGWNATGQYQEGTLLVLQANKWLPVTIYSNGAEQRDLFCLEAA